MSCSEQLLSAPECLYPGLVGIMVFLRSGVTASLVLSSLFGSIHGVPLADKLGRLSPSARDLLKRSTPAAPRFLAYNDEWLNPLPSASDLEVSKTCMA
jgi:chitinase